MITKEQWFKHSSFQTDLAAILANPVMIAAMDVVRQQGAKSIDTTLAATTNSLIDFFALMGAKKDGFNEAFMFLEQLTRPLPPPTPPREAWKTNPAETPAGKPAA